MERKVGDSASSLKLLIPVNGLLVPGCQLYRDRLSPNTAGATTTATAAISSGATYGTLASRPRQRTDVARPAPGHVGARDLSDEVIVTGVSRSAYDPAGSVAGATACRARPPPGFCPPSAGSPRPASTIGSAPRVRLPDDLRPQLQPELLHHLQHRCRRGAARDHLAGVALVDGQDRYREPDVNGVVHRVLYRRQDGLDRGI